MNNPLSNINLPVLQCGNCGHKWIPRKFAILRCPNCNAPYPYSRKHFKYDDRARKELGGK